MKATSNIDIITVADFEQCLHGNMSVLLPKFWRFLYRFDRYKLQCKQAFTEVQTAIGDVMKDRRIINAMALSRKYQLWEMKRTIYALIYNVMRYKEPNSETIEILKQNGITYDSTKTHADNMQIIAGQISRCEAVLSETGLRLQMIQCDDTDNGNDFDYMLMQLNYIAKSNLRKSTTTVAEYLAAKKIVEKITKETQKIQ